MTPKLPELSMFFLLYNEEDNIGPLLEAASVVAAKLAERYELLPVIYEASSDRTLEIARARADRDERIRPVVQPISRPGMGNAIRVGFETARYQHVFYADGDNQFDLKEFASFLPHIGEPCVVAGYRIARQDPKFRLFTSAVYNRIVRVLFGVRERDVDCAFRYVHRDVLKAVDLTCATGLGTTELLVRARKAGFPIHEVGVNHFPRTAGEPVFEVKGSLNVFNFPKPSVVRDLLGEMRMLRRTLHNS
ncbi:glycosyltransferase family 2 protein [bacterium]|nr:glycosyltransferase family 2 protein [candidate division CSSED10-310 bacterium]